MDESHLSLPLHYDSAVDEEFDQVIWLEVDRVVVQDHVRSACLELA